MDYYPELATFHTRQRKNIIIEGFKDRDESYVFVLHVMGILDADFLRLFRRHIVQVNHPAAGLEDIEVKTPFDKFPLSVFGLKP